MHLRNAVLWFAAHMETELRNHDDRPGWDDDDTMDLFDHLKEEVRELRNALVDSSDDSAIISEAADVANMAMMIADRIR